MRELMEVYTMEDYSLYIAFVQDQKQRRKTRDVQATKKNYVFSKSRYDYRRKRGENCGVYNRKIKWVENLSVHLKKERAEKLGFSAKN